MGRGQTLLFIAEKFGPAVLAVASFFSSVYWLQFALGEASWSNRILDRVVNASSAGVMFWGIATTLLIGLDEKQIIQRLRKVGEYHTVVWYFAESLFACLFLLLLSIIVEPLSTNTTAILLSGLWIGACVWAVATVVRTFIGLILILLRA